ncbi:hypothetical protein [Parabacteroides merdae]|jgi:hypothetical protein|uniref:hypothetical protein n=1 Tax=Parabacteroides merdae TaxID=46503 RepID=UPI0034A3D39A
MRHLMAAMIDILNNLAQTFSLTGNNLASVGLGAGNDTLSAGILQRMLIAPESQKAMQQMFPELKGLKMEDVFKREQNGYAPTESDFKRWRSLINERMDKELQKAGMDKDAAMLFKQRTGNLAYKIDRLCRKYTDPTIREQKITELIDKQINDAVRVSQSQQMDENRRTAMQNDPKCNTDSKVQVTWGVKEQPAFFNGLTTSNTVPIWVPLTAASRVELSGAEMQQLHAAELKANEQMTAQANEKLSLTNIEEGIKKGMFTADDLMRIGADNYSAGETKLLAVMGVVDKYEEYRSSLLLNNDAKAGRLWNEMIGEVNGYMRDLRDGSAMAVGQGVDMDMEAERNRPAGMGMGFKWGFN